MEERVIRVLKELVVSDVSNYSDILNKLSAEVGKGNFPVDLYRLLELA